MIMLLHVRAYMDRPPAYSVHPQAAMRRSEARELFDRMDKNSSGFVDFEEFRSMFNNLVR